MWHWQYPDCWVNGAAPLWYNQFHLLFWLPPNSRSSKISAPIHNLFLISIKSKLPQGRGKHINRRSHPSEFQFRLDLPPIEHREGVQQHSSHVTVSDRNKHNLLMLGLCVYTHAEKFLLDTHCHHVHKPIGALICTAPEERAVPGWVHH